MACGPRQDGAETGSAGTRDRTRVRLGCEREEGDDRWTLPVSDSDERREALRGPARRRLGRAGLLLGRGRAAKRTRPGIRGPSADFGRRAALAGLGFKQKEIRGLF